MTAPSHIGDGGPIKSVSGAAISITPPTAGTYAIGDLFVLTITGDGAGTLTTPTGWTAVSGSPQDTGGTAITSTTLWVYWRRATSTSHTASDLNVSSIDAGNYTVGRMHVYRDVATTGNPIHVSAGSVDSSSNTTTTCPSVTTTTPDTLVLIAISHAVDVGSANFTTGGTSTYGSGYLSTPGKRGDDSTTDSNGGGVALWDGIVPSPSSDTGASIQQTVASLNACITFALAPATVSPIDSDSGSATDDQSVIVVVSKNSSDSASATERSPSIGRNSSDASSGTDNQILTQTKNSSDSASGSETQSTAATLTKTDTASGSDTGSIASTFTKTDAGSGAETQSLTAAIADSDLVLGNDTQTVSGGTNPSGADTTSVSETWGIAATRASSDSASGAESWSIVATRSSTDAANGAETQGAPPATLSASDLITGVDNESVASTANVSDSDAGSAIDTQDVYVVGTLRAPTNVQVSLVNMPSGELSYTQLFISWDAVDGADLYQLERNSVIVASNISATDYTDSGLSDGIQYSYRVRAVRTIV